MWTEVKLAFSVSLVTRPLPAPPSFQKGSWSPACWQPLTQTGKEIMQMAKKPLHTSFSVLLRRIWYMRRQIKYSSENAFQVFCFSCLFYYRDGSKNLWMKRAVGFSSRTETGGEWGIGRQRVGSGDQSRVAGNGTHRGREGCFPGEHLGICYIPIWMPPKCLKKPS